MISDVSNDLLLRLGFYWLPAILFLVIAILSARRVLLHHRWFGSAVIIVVSLLGFGAQVELATTNAWPHAFGFVYGGIGLTAYGAQTWVHRYKLLR